jgi:hypothetical protein
VVALWAKQENLVLDYDERYVPPEEGQAAFQQQASKETSFWWYILAHVLMQILVRACD